VTDRFDPIFVLDSGLGGLTVVEALRRRLPDERIIYFGDTARLPYGSKTRQTVGSFVKQIIEWGLTFRPKHVVIACNTASALALDETQRLFPDLAISGVIEPGAVAAAGAVASLPTPCVGVIATEATIRSNAYQDALARHAPATEVLARATPLLVPLIEEGRRPSDAVVNLALRQYLRPMLKRKINALVLGCTHYPLLRPALRRALGEGVTVIDSAEQCAQDVAARLAAAGRLATAGPAERSADERLKLFVTDDPDRFGTLAPRFLGFPVGRPQRVAPETLYDSASRPSLRLRA
jgi:glutamate racemase